MILFLLALLVLPNGPAEQIAAGQRFVHVPIGQYPLDKTLEIPSGVTVYCEVGAEFVAAPGAFLGTHDSLVLIRGSLITIENCQFRMLKDSYGVYKFKPDGSIDPTPNALGYVASEDRHAISLIGAKNVKLINIRAEFSGGDGIFIGSAGPSSARIPCENITITHSVMDSNLRQGVSVVSVKNLLIEDCVFSHTYGTSPQAGIDIEPEYRDSVDVTVRRCQSIGNRGPAYMVGLFKVNPDDQPSRIVFEQCTQSGVPDDQLNFRLGGVLNEGFPSGYMRDDIPRATVIQWNDLVWRK